MGGGEGGEDPASLLNDLLGGGGNLDGASLKAGAIEGEHGGGLCVRKGKGKTGPTGLTISSTHHPQGLGPGPMTISLEPLGDIGGNDSDGETIQVDNPRFLLGKGGTVGRSISRTGKGVTNWLSGGDKANDPSTGGSGTPGSGGCILLDGKRGS